MLTASDFPHLSNFVGCTFHPDCFEIADTYRGIVDVALAGWGATNARRLATDIGGVLASNVSDDELAQWLEVAGLCVVLDAEGYTARSFLEMIAERIRVHHPQP